MRRIWKTDFWGPISPRMLKKYKLDYQKGNLTSLPYADSSFDVVSCISVLEHMPDNDQVQGIKEMSRVLKQGGKLIITYDKREQDLTDIFIQASGMTPSELVFFAKPDNLYNSTYAHAKDVIGICLIK